MWTDQKKEYNNVKSGTKLVSTHEYKGDKQIKNIQPSCSCVSYSKSNNLLTLKWNTSSKYDEDYVSFKYITIEYQDGSVDDIELKAYMIK